MALEVNEIGIRMHVRDGKVDADDQDAWPAGSSKDNATMTMDREGIVQECVRRVLRALKALQER